MKLIENTLELILHPADGPASRRKIAVEAAYFTRHAGRDEIATQASLDEIRSRGYKVHPNPGLCAKSRYLLTQDKKIEVQGRHTSGEVEAVAIRDGDDILITVGSDHNDRSLESMWTQALGKIFDTAKSKQMTPAVLADDAWVYDDVKDHWDRLVLRSRVNIRGELIPYQEFELAKLIDLDTHLDAGYLNQEGSFLFGGTYSPLESVPDYVFTFGEIRANTVFPTDFQFEIHDPILSRSISHAYNVRPLEEPGSISL